MLQINITPDELKNKKSYNIDDLLSIMRLLRGEGGCPWDREQTHESIRGNVIEEAYEVAEAIDHNSKEELCEELGDLLLQVVFHAQMEAEKNGFDFNDVCDGICKKLILRHPHIFAGVKADNSEQVLNNWDAIKKEEKNQQTYTDTLNAVPSAFPALMRAAKVQKRAAKAGFDWDDVTGALSKVYEEADELSAEISKKDVEAAERELGDLLFAAVNVSRFLKVDAELSLQRATEKFISRFERVENMAESKGIDMKSAGLDVLDELWDEVKHADE